MGSRTGAQFAFDSDIPVQTRGRPAFLTPARVLFLWAIAFCRAGWQATADSERPGIETARSRAASSAHGSTHARDRDTD